MEIIKSEEDFYGTFEIEFPKKTIEEKNAVARKYMKKYYKENKEKCKKSAAKSRKRNFKSYFKHKLSVKKSICKKKELKFDLDYKWFINEYKKGCNLTGMRFYTNLKETRRTYSPYQVSIDRFNPNMGYTKNNCRLILSSLNMFKSIWSDDQIYKIAEKLLENRTNPY